MTSLSLSGVGIYSDRTGGLLRRENNLSLSAMW